MRLIDDLLKAQERYQVEHIAPAPAGYRFSRATLDQLRTETLLERLSATETRDVRLWGVPCLIDERVPVGEIRFAKDAATWQSWQASKEAQ